jgi:predicted permease
MPVAFNALVPPVVYGFDLDLANSAWIITTLGLLVILPVLYVLLVA